MLAGQMTGLTSQAPKELRLTGTNAERKGKTAEEKMLATFLAFLAISST